MNSRNSLGIGACFFCALICSLLVGYQMTNAQQAPSAIIVRGQSLSFQDRMKLLRQKSRTRRSRSTTSIPTNQNLQQTQYDARRESTPIYSSLQNQNYDTIRQSSFAEQDLNNPLAQQPVSNPVTTSPFRNDIPDRTNLGPQRNLGEPENGIVPPAPAPAAESPGTLNNLEGVFNTPGNLNGADGFSLVPSTQNPQSANPGIGSNFGPPSNPLIAGATEENLYQPSFSERLNEFYVRHGLIPQSSSVTMSVMAGSTDDIGFFDFYVQTTFAVASVPGLTISPSFQIDFLNGPTRTDLPPRLYNIGSEIRLAKLLSQRMSYELAVRPAVYSDFEAGGSEAARVTGRGLGFYTWSTQTQLVFGFVYFDRKNLKILPAVGLIHIPQGDWRLELVYPRPRILKLISRNENREKWAYISGEIGGGSWAIERSGRPDDVATLSDLRLLFGVQNRYANGRSWFLEGGLVFDRKLQYETGPGDYDLDTTGMIRAGFVY